MPIASKTGCIQLEEFDYEAGKYGNVTLLSLGYLELRQKQKFAHLRNHGTIMFPKISNQSAHF
jgi:hypothetical protein